jgi:hypothetical protein
MRAIDGSSTLPTIESKAFRMLVGTPKGKRPLERARRKWADSVKMILECYDGVVENGLV